MKVVIVALFVVLFVAIEAQQYTSKYDNIDYNKILNSDRLLKNYVNCLLDKGRCGPDATDLKKILPDALTTACQKCSDSQKEAAKKIVRFLMKNKRDMWNELEAKYDPSGSYKKQYEAELKAEGIEF